jgi:hypothetical protein
LDIFTLMTQVPGRILSVRPLQDSRSYAARRLGTVAAIRTFLTYLLIFSYSCMSTGHAQDHLEPEEGSLAEYDFEFEFYLNIKKYLVRDTDSKYAARMICLPSFSPEWVITLREAPDRGEWSLELNVAEEQFWTAKHHDRIRITKKTLPIDKTIAEKISRVWLAMLRSVRYPSASGDDAVDGVEYHFSRSMPPTGVLAGQIWSASEDPPQSSLTERLIHIGNNMRQYVECSQERRQSTASLLAKQLDELYSIQTKEPKRERNRRGKGDIEGEKGT